MVFWQFRLRRKISAVSVCASTVAPDFRHPTVLFVFFFRELLSGNVTPPPAARPLYEALENRGSAADQQRLLSQGFRVG